MHCPKCGSKGFTKNGFVKEKQRYKCQDCGCNYTQSSRYRIDYKTRREAIRLYLEGVGFRGIERLLGVSHVSVMRWVKALGERIDQSLPKEQRNVAIMELDEMWHFTSKKKTNAGSGSPMIETLKKPAAFN